MVAIEARRRLAALQGANVVWEPITITENQVRAFAEKAAAFSRSLDESGRAMLREIISRAGGDVTKLDASHESANAFAEALDDIWGEETTIAPLYSGNMPNDGGDKAG